MSVIATLKPLVQNSKTALKVKDIKSFGNIPKSKIVVFIRKYIGWFYIDVLFLVPIFIHFVALCTTYFEQTETAMSNRCTCWHRTNAVLMLC